MSIAWRAGSGLVLCLSLTGPALAQDAKPAEQPTKAEAQQPAPADPFAAIPAARPEDVKSLDAIVAALYDVISGDAGVQRDWNRFRSLFYPGARMIPSGKNAKTGKVGARIASPEAYIQANESFLEGEGFHELELGRHVDSYGTLSQVFSAYEARKKKSDEKPFLRGINSIQLLNDGTRWWVLTLAWAPETPDNPLPERFTKKAER
ncbi:MAG: hypothetical protein M3N39_14150 [Pseudomonadota bacterium]|nr:hypothetical protein [Pseudomonadota bacterium]